jgi:Bacterial regulatory proteins, tetR family
VNGVSAGRTGLREQKKRETRQRIAAIARELFGHHGYERVTVAQVAVAAGVSEATVFNYFPTKETSPGEYGGSVTTTSFPIPGESGPESENGSSAGPQAQPSTVFPGQALNCVDQPRKGD